MLSSVYNAIILLSMSPVAQLFVCLLVMRVDCVQTADPIAMKFGGMVRIGAGHIVPAR